VAASRRADDQRIVVTGMGAVSVLGDTPAAMFAGLIAGRSGITRWKSRGEGIYSQIGGDLSGFDAFDHLRRSGSPQSVIDKAAELLRISPRACQLAVAVSTQAYLDAAWDEGTAASR
jgi:3-oxoacyl-(acyl-carrier-protein) synthase